MTTLAIDDEDVMSLLILGEERDEMLAEIDLILWKQ